MDLIDRGQAISKLEDLIIARQGWLSDGTAEIRGIDAAICELAALPSGENIQARLQWEAGCIASRNNCIKEILRLLRQELAFREAYATPLEDMDTGILCGLRMALQKVEGLQSDKIEGQLQMEIQED